MTRRKPSTCCIPYCTGTVTCRGLCRRCENNARNAVRRGKTTWAELEELGLAKATTYRALFREALKAAKNGKH